MFKRSTQLTALLVAAASVVSSVPAMAATKLANKDGNIERGVAFKDGKYLYEGYRSEEDDNGIYYNNGSSDKKLDEVDAIDDEYGKFGDKFVSLKAGSDDYVVDLETGKVVNENTAKDLIDTASTRLSNKLDDAKRYEKEKITFENATNNEFSSTRAEIMRVSSDKLEDAYYAYNVPDTDLTDGRFDKFGYTNEAGKYIDCSYDLNLYAYATSEGQAKGGKMYKISDIENTASTDFDNNKDRKDDEISVKGIKFVKYIGQDDKYIYSVIAVKLDGSYSLYNNASIGSDEDHYYVQKVSKEQGDKEKDAYKPKTTECFEIAPKEAKDGAIAMGNGDVADAYNALLLKGDFEKFKNDPEKHVLKYAVVDGVIYAYFEDDVDKVKIFKMPLRPSEKLDRHKENGDKEKDLSQISAHVVRKDGDKDHKITDVEDIKDGRARSWTVDANGALWAIEHGKVYRSVKMGDFEEVYECDRSLDCIDVYDEKNLFLWDSTGKVYTNVTEGSAAAKEEAEQIAGKQEQATTEPAVTAKTGWDKLADGTWKLYDATGKVLTGWQKDAGTWYYLDPTTGIMKTGWQKDAGNWYYLNPSSGAMQTGWVQDGSTWYYCNASGAMLASQWFQDGDGRWYYLTQSGAMAVNTTIDGYVIGANGAWVK